MSATRRPSKPAGHEKPRTGPDTGRLLRDVKTVMRRWNSGAKALEDLTTERDRVIRDAHAGGLTPSQLSTETGLSTQRIDQIRRGARL